MSATVQQATGWEKIGTSTEVPPGTKFPLLASAQAGKGQALYFDSTGATANVGLNDGTVAGQICAGVAEDELSPQTVSAIAGANDIRLWSGQGTGATTSSVTNDGMVVTDVLVPLFDSGSGVPGKLSNASGNDRSFLGLGLGLNTAGYPIVWAGRVASLLARALHLLNNDAGATWGYAADVSATTDQGSLGGSALSTIGFVIPRPKRRTIIQSVEIIPSATQAAAGTNYRVVQLWKVDTTGTVAIASSPLVATFTTATQGLTIGQPTAFALGASSALLLRETDILVGTSVHTASGVALPQSAIRANAKVI